MGVLTLSGRSARRDVPILEWMVSVPKLTSGRATLGLSVHFEGSKSLFKLALNPDAPKSAILKLVD